MSGRRHPCDSGRQNAFEEWQKASVTTVQYRWRTPGRQMLMSLHLLQQSVVLAHDMLSNTAQRLSLLAQEQAHPLSEPGAVVVDVGASVGAFAIAVALHFPLARVFALEPEPTNFGLLLWNIRENNVSSRVWPVQAWMAGETAGRLEACVLAGEGCEFGRDRVQAVSLKGLMWNLGLQRIHWLNLDCESCEWALSADDSFLAHLKKSVDFFTAEMHPSHSSLSVPGERRLAAGRFIRSVCRDRRIQEKLLWCLGQPQNLPARFITDALLCSARFSLLEGHEMPESRNIFVLSSFSHDDVTQWPLIPHWMSHYTARLGLDPQRFLLILHSDAGNLTGLASMSQWFNREFGVLHMMPVAEGYSSILHMRIKHELLHRHVGPMDWVVQADADELVLFPGGQLARDALQRLDAAGENVHFGLMVDRLAANGDIDAAPKNRSSIFLQYPLNCAMTVLVQNSDMRKACAYRGFLRTTTGNHNVFGFNRSLDERIRRKRCDGHLKIIRRAFGDRIYRVLPGSERSLLPVVRPTLEFATVYHFKWAQGLGKKLERRRETEKDTAGQYTNVLAILGSGGKIGPLTLRKVCNMRDPLVPGAPIRALPAVDLTELFLNVKREHMAKAAAASGDPKYVARALQTNIHYGVARETGIPTQ